MLTSSSVNTEKSFILFIGNDQKETDLLAKRIRTEGHEFTSTGFDVDFKTMAKWRKPDLILVDIDRGEWFSRDLPGLLKTRLDHSIPVILVVYVNDQESIQEGIRLGFSDFIIKPVNWLIMKTRIQNVIVSHRLMAESRKISLQLNQIQKLSGVGTWEIGASPTHMLCSEGISQILGLLEPVEEMELKQFLEFVHPNDRNDVGNLLRQSINRMYPFKRDHRIVLMDGTEKIIDHQVFMMVDRVTKKRKVVGTIQDITTRKLNEYLEQDRNLVLEMIVRNETMDAIFKEILRIVSRQKATAGCVISLLKQNKLQIIAASTILPAAFIRAIDSQEIGPKSGAGGAAAYLGDMVSTSNIAESPLWEASRRTALEHGYSACHAHPVLSSKGQVFGIIAFFYKNVCMIDESVNYLLKIISNLASIAIERIRLNKELVHRARHDSLTGLPNRFFLAERITDIMDQARRYHEKIAMLFIDLDRFKQVNDSLGHKIGDELLKELARRISALTRKSDFFARVGGDEFIQVLGKVNEKDGIAAAARRLIAEVSKPCHIENHDLYVGASIGIALFPEDTTEPVQLQKYSDIAMYYAKKRGGNGFQFFTSDMDTKAVSQLEIENDLRKALERNEFELFYQPQFLLKDKQLIGFEALIRWNHPEYGRISPANFIPVAEKTHLIIPMGTWVMDEACRQNAAWEKAGHGPFRIAVNVSVIQFLQPDFLDIVQQALNRHQLAPYRLEVEITESVVIEDIKSVSRRLEQIRNLGVHTAIDDFGTGYSSMAYIEGLPVDAIKIDQSFVQRIGGSDGSDKKSRILLESIVNMASKLNLKTIAEGFETENQYQFLRQISCDIGQGYYLGVPMSVGDVEFHCRDELECSLDWGKMGK
jgi:diguanylate cyclase (GGDEF)-like protein/PAS domain S-box-containing protein